MPLPDPTALGPATSEPWRAAPPTSDAVPTPEATPPEPSAVSDRDATRQARMQGVGARPGTLAPREGSLKPRLFLFSYDENGFDENEFQSYDELLHTFRSQPERRHWIDVRGYDDVALMQRIMVDFELHPLQMEDVLGDYQRAKAEVFGNNRLFLVSRMTEFTADLEIDDDQLSLFTGPNYVLSFQDDYDDCLDAVRQRIRSGFSQIKVRPPLYLAYALTDVVLDHYYPTMAAIGDYIEELETLIIRGRPTKRLLARILQIKKDIVRFRRLVYPERDKILELLRLHDEVVPEEMKVFFRDCYDHAIQAMDLSESYRESVSSLVDLYMSDQSNRMNEVMKVLTMISAVFIPLSFIAGVYGMNFSRENPHGGVNHLNMPELYDPFGYPIVLFIMAAIAIGMLVYFYRKGWLTS
ncbi:magnesium/cobalt transporter CorA [Hymenobacter busanensis]|uniref:Magnesium transport protein CorA n=1 Tax=Hymenobacter busanensis TaxID=2607656 RepID=A0A7L4ZTE9_9BACT|nr:magnesium/cobalt transporter CorA [Hymenobacter busanensis]KAA9339611.1 magnesium/cobalt transporter CorA [Hymenobacter busanensis]QHJ06634.1 magnesium/cobalt transporter CorA [Hymenobacter busanensis]